MRYLTIIGDSEIKPYITDDFTVLAFASKEDRSEAENIMLECRRDDEEVSDEENMLFALANSGIDFEVFHNISKVWL